MADQRDQEMILHQESLDTPVRLHDSGEFSLRNFLQLAYVEHTTEHERSLFYTLLLELLSEHWQEREAEYRSLFRHEADIAEKERLQPSAYRCSACHLVDLMPMTWQQSVSANVKRLEYQTRKLQAHNTELVERVRRDQEEILKKEKLRKELDQSHETLKSEAKTAIEECDDHKSAISHLRKALKSKDQEVRDQDDHHRDLVAQHKQEVKDLKMLNGKLHNIVRETAQQNDPYDDQRITTMFKELEKGIEHLVKKHFAATGEKTTWKDYNDVKALDDRDFFLQAHIATVIAQQFFSHDVRLFGLDEGTDHGQAAFEKLLEDWHVPPQEIVAWRIQTIKVAGLVAARNRHHRTANIPHELRNNLSQVHRNGSHLRNWTSTKSALQALCSSAFDLAIALRSCRVVYEWNQLASPSSLKQTDIERIDNYNIKTKPTGKPVKILFGPVYKQVDDMPCLRPGRVLYG